MFHTTRWSVVLAARSADAVHSSAALEHLCRAYWPPLYGYVRRLGRDAHDAQDLTQEFFARLLSKEWLHKADPEKGRFRTFLLVAMKRFLANEWDRAQTHKRGSGQPALHLDTAIIESQCADDGTETLSADHLYEQRWALTLLTQVMARLRAGEAMGSRLNIVHLSPAS